MNYVTSTPDRLLATARKLFAEKGFEAASIREITSGAGANLGAVTYHFGSKQALYHAILEQVFGDMAQRIEVAAALPGPADRRLRAIVHAFFEFFAEFPEAPRLMIRELAVGRPPPEPTWPFLRRNLAAITDVLRSGQASGELSAAEPLLMAFSIVSQSVWFAVAGRHFTRVMGLPLDPNALAPRVEQHISNVVCNALLARKESR
jgi:AcrR family transcriptional regulator